jgi:diguanylate cyclase (GGDEF)-like protein
MKNILKKIGTWLFLGSALDKSFNIDDIMKIVTVNIIAIFGTFYVVFFFTPVFLQDIYPTIYCIIAYILAFNFVLVFIAIHTDKGIEFFNVIKSIVVLILMLFYGLIYAKITYGDIWSFLVPIMIIFLTDFFLGLILCLCYFFFMLEVEFIYEIHSRESFYRYAFIYWSQVIMVGVYEALRIEYNKRMLRDKRKIERLSITDHLTKLYNRRHFSNVINKEFARAIRQKECLSFLMIDADKFKDYNDTYGHLQGDELLVSLAEVFRGIAKRSEDFVFRMGGEEFGVLLPNTDFNGAISIAEKIREEVQSNTKISVSVGVACVYPKIGETSEGLLKLADSNLYKTKEMGRNRVVG